MSWVCKVLRWSFSGLLLLLVGCSNEEGAQSQIQQFLDIAEAAAESRSVSAVLAQVDEGYQDAAGRDRRTLARILTGYFLTHQQIHLLVQVKRLQLLNDQEANLDLLVAMAAKPLESVAQLATYRADLHAFHLRLRKQAGEWKLVASDWHRAHAEDFF